MPEIVDFVNRGAMTITPAIVEKVLRHLPQWKLEFTQIYEPLFPHLVDQLEFLADAVEDTAEGAYKDLPYSAFSQAVFVGTRISDCSIFLDRFFRLSAYSSWSKRSLVM